MNLFPIINVPYIECGLEVKCSGQKTVRASSLSATRNLYAFSEQPGISKVYNMPFSGGHDTGEGSLLLYLEVQHVPAGALILDNKAEQREGAGPGK